MHVTSILQYGVFLFVYVSGDVGNYYYGQGHPMKPHRIRMTHNLLLNYGLYRKMEIYVCLISVAVRLTQMTGPPELLLCVSGTYLSSVLQRPHKASGEEMTKYHSDDYIKFLRSIRPDNMSEYSKQMQRCKFGQRGVLTGCLDVNVIVIISFALALQLMWERTAPCLMVCLSSASSQEGVPLVSVYHICPSYLLYSL